MPDRSSDAWDQQDDPFADDYYRVPCDEVIRTRAEDVLQTNRDALRHFVELALWGVLDNPDQLKVLLALLWHWKAIDTWWLAEATFMTVQDVRDLVDSQPVVTFNCLDCGTELATRTRRHQIRIQHSLEHYCAADAGSSPSADLFCGSCQEQREDYAEQQRRLDDLRNQAMLAEYRARPYADRSCTSNLRDAEFDHIHSWLRVVNVV